MTSLHTPGAPLTHMPLSSPPERPRYSLATWLMASIACVTLPPSLLFGAWTVLDREAHTRELLSEETRYHIDSAEADMRVFLSLKREILEVVASSFGALERWEEAELQRIANAQLTAASTFKSLYLANMSARPLVFAPERPPHERAISYEDRDYYTRLLQTQRTSFGSLVMGRQIRSPSVHIAAPVRGGAGEPLRGFVVGGVPPSGLGALVEHALGHRAEYRGMLVDERGRVAYDTRGRLEPLTPLSAALTREGGALAEPLSCDLPQRLLQIDGEEVWAHCKRLELDGLPWTLWVTLPLRVLNDAAHSAALIAFEGFIITLLATLALGAFVSQSA